uniref:Single domain-containing protein n=1 Tax=Stomoxys calcitrans TaxID=35570 RepID=A0A1I8QAN8_STOCA
MKSITALVVIGILIVSAAADVRYRGNAVHSDHPGQCYYEELKQAIPKNQSFSPVNLEDHCERIFCRSDYVLVMEYCGRHNLSPNATCAIRSDIRRPYPGCCPTLVCENESNFI